MNEQQRPADVGKTDFSVTRTKDNPLGLDDLGLKGDIKPENARTPDEIEPDPAKEQGTQ